MKRIDLIVDLTHYSHSGQGFFSLTFRSSLCRGADPELLRRFILEGGRTPLYMDLEKVGFKGVLQSAVSRKKHLTLRVHARSSRFLALKFFEMVGRSALVLSIRMPWRGSSYLPREEYVRLRENVRRLLGSLSEVTGMNEEAILYRETSSIGGQGVTTLTRMSPVDLRNLEKRFSLLLKEIER